MKRTFRYLGGVERLVKSANKNQQFRDDYKAVKGRLESGIHPLDINTSSTTIGPNIFLIKTDKGRYLVEFKGSEVVGILGMGYRGDKKNMIQFENLMNKMYHVDIKGYQ